MNDQDITAEFEKALQELAQHDDNDDGKEPSPKKAKRSSQESANLSFAQRLIKQREEDEKKERLAIKRKAMEEKEKAKAEKEKAKAARLAEKAKSAEQAEGESVKPTGKRQKRDKNEGEKENQEKKEMKEKTESQDDEEAQMEEMLQNL